jgi:hypothetical protein
LLRGFGLFHLPHTWARIRINVGNFTLVLSDDTHNGSCVRVDRVIHIREYVRVGVPAIETYVVFELRPAQLLGTPNRFGFVNQTPDIRGCTPNWEATFNCIPYVKAIQDEKVGLPVGIIL